MKGIKFFKIKLFGVLCLVVMLTLPILAGEKNVKLSPPWYTLHHKITYTIGADPTVQVLPLRSGDKAYYIDIIKKAGNPYALAAILRDVYPLGNITVYVQVYDQYGQPVKGELPVGTDPVTAVKVAVELALQSNSYYVEVLTPEKIPFKPQLAQVVLVVKKAVIQFWNDDLSDYYGNFNAVADDVFAEVIKHEYEGPVTLGFTTENTK
jgi:hypothetical protein